MGFNWEKFWNVGGHLKDFSEEEEYQRSAVGRYYYACYLKAREAYNRKNNFRIGRRISHQGLIKKFKESNNETEKKIGKYLEELLRFGKNADYDLDFNTDVNSAKRKSKNLLECLKRIEK